MSERSVVTLQDVARDARVSPATASRVLSGSSHPVSPDRQRRVLEAAERLDYVPNAQARALAAARNSTVGIIVHDVSDPYFAEIVRGAIRVADREGRLVVICNTYRDPVRERESITALRAQRVEALLVVGSGFVDPRLDEQITGDLRLFSGDGGRIVLVGRSQPGIDAVLPDNTGGSYQMGRALLELGHDELGVIAGPRDLRTVHQRLDGLRRALDEAGFGLDETRVEYTEFTRDGGYDGARRLAARCPDVTAVYALSDAMAMGAMTALREIGWRVPEDISLAGFDDTPTARDMNPALTTVRVRMETMGERAMSIALEPPGYDLHVEHHACEVIVRKTTSALERLPG